MWQTTHFSMLVTYIYTRLYLYFIVPVYVTPTTNYKYVHFSTINKQ